MNTDETAGESIVPLAEDPLEKLKTAVFSQAINASPIALAVLGWITDMTITEPRIEELHATTDGRSSPSWANA